MTDLRASDADRERAAVALRQACEDGRLDVDELEERLDATYASKTLSQLEVLLADLGTGAGLEPAAPAAPAMLVGGTGGGRRGFTFRDDLPLGPADARAHAMEFLTPFLGSYGYRLVDGQPDQLAFERTHRPAWTIVTAVALFPFGLVALLHTDRARVYVRLEPLGPRRTRLTAQGVGPAEMRRALAALSR